MLTTTEPIQHREAETATHYYQGMQARNKTLSRHKYKGIEIEQKVDGWQIGFHSFLTLGQAHAFIDRRKAFILVHGALTKHPLHLSLWVENCMVYKCEAGQHKAAAEKVAGIVKALGLKLEVFATTFNTADSIIIQQTTKEVIC